MTQTHVSLDFSGSDVASRRTAAVADFIAQARRLVPDPERATPEQLRAVATLLERLGTQRELFAAEHFPVSEQNPAQVYRLSEDAAGRYALYLSTGLPGKSQPPHDHTTWAIIAGVTGNERNIFFRRDKTQDATRDTLTAERTVDVSAGVSVVLSPTDVHTIELIGDEPGLHLHFYGLGIDRLPGRVVFESLEGGSFRTFGPPKSIHHPLISPQALKTALFDGEEIAVLDVRETGVF
ncbi:sulfurtransferase, partial [Acidovorax sp. CCYZU-2555]|nr:sulfurtransferase [Acidovorax sp. CCYZU-2555]